MVKASAISIKLKHEIAILSLEGSDKEHSFDIDLLQELNEHIITLNNSKEIKVLIIKGKDKAFYSGVKKDHLKKMNTNELEKYSILGQKTLQHLEFADFITIAAINGLVENAGLEITLACDIRIGTDKAKIGFSDVKNSIIPSWGSIQRLQRIMKQSSLLEFIFSSKIYHAEDAFKLGLLDKVVHNDNLNDSIDELTDSIIKCNYQTIKNLKSIIKVNFHNCESESFMNFQAEMFAKTINE